LLHSLPRMPSKKAELSNAWTNLSVLITVFEYGLVAPQDATDDAFDHLLRYCEYWRRNLKSFDYRSKPIELVEPVEIGVCKRTISLSTAPDRSFTGHEEAILSVDCIYSVAVGVIHRCVHYTEDCSVN
jgi:hypothetical protein